MTYFFETESRHWDFFGSFRSTAESMRTQMTFFFVSFFETGSRHRDFFGSFCSETSCCLLRKSLFSGDLSKSGKLIEIKPPLA